MSPEFEKALHEIGLMEAKAAWPLQVEFILESLQPQHIASLMTTNQAHDQLQQLKTASAQLKMVREFVERLPAQLSEDLDRYVGNVGRIQNRHSFGLDSWQQQTSLLQSGMEALQSVLQLQSSGAETRGRPPDERSHYVADQLALIHAIGLKRLPAASSPNETNDGNTPSGPFTRAIKVAFDELGLPGTPTHYGQQAIKRLRSGEMFKATEDAIEIINHPLFGSPELVESLK